MFNCDGIKQNKIYIILTYIGTFKFVQMPLMALSRGRMSSDLRISTKGSGAAKIHFIYIFQSIYTEHGLASAF